MRLPQDVRGTRCESRDCVERCLMIEPSCLPTFSGKVLGGRGANYAQISSTSSDMRSVFQLIEYLLLI
nr:MAG TPA: hypothetical protein [Caudoviricetes sp.]